MHVPELNRMGAKIYTSGNLSYRRSSNLNGAELWPLIYELQWARRSNCNNHT